MNPVISKQGIYLDLIKVTEKELNEIKQGVFICPEIEVGKLLIFNNPIVRSHKDEVLIICPSYTSIEINFRDTTQCRYETKPEPLILNDYTLKYFSGTQVINNKHNTEYIVADIYIDCNNNTQDSFKRQVVYTNGELTFVRGLEEFVKKFKISI